jgi:hypothetical protein
MEIEVLHVSLLEGKNIVRWIGTEMALGGGGSSVDDQTVDTGWCGAAPVVWEHKSVPFRQFIGIDIELASGEMYRLLSQFEDRTNFYGLYLRPLSEMTTPRGADVGSIYRARELVELPTGVATVNVLRQDGPTSVIEATLLFNQLKVRLLSAEVYERGDESFEVVEGDESILVQLNGLKPEVV